MAELMLAENRAYVLIKKWMRDVESNPPGIVSQGILSPTLTILSDMCAQAIRDAEKKTRAEVLAAAITWGVEWGLRHAGLSREQWPHSWDAGFPGMKAQALLDAQHAPELQPAAKHLEELLEEARRKEGEKVRKEALLDVLAFNTGLGCTPQEGYKWLVEALRDTQRLSIEKARASEGKG